MDEGFHKGINIFQMKNCIQILYLEDNDNSSCAEISRLTKHENAWSFYRLYVPKNSRGKGIATILMKELVKILDENKIVLYNSINPYGPLNFKQLVSFYEKFGFVHDKDGTWVREPKVKAEL